MATSPTSVSTSEAGPAAGAVPVAGRELPAEFVRNVAGYFPDGEGWLERLPRRVASLCERWRLTELTAFETLTFNFVAHARCDGEPVVLKVSADPEVVRTEAAWLGQRQGATVDLLASEADAYLMSRVEPGLPLRPRDAVEDEVAAGVIASLIGRLSCDVPAAEGPFRSIAGDDRGFADYACRHGKAGAVDADLVDRAASIWKDLTASAAPDCLLHGDFHHGNVLTSRGAGEPHVVIDPHGLLGETAYECAAMLRNGLDWAGTGAELARALDTRVAVLAETVGLDRKRIVGWGFAQNALSVCWEALATGSVEAPVLAAVRTLGNDFGRGL